MILINWELQLYFLFLNDWNASNGIYIFYGRYHIPRSPELTLHGILKKYRRFFSFKNSISSILKTYDRSDWITRFGRNITWYCRLCGPGVSILWCEKRPWKCSFWPDVRNFLWKSISVHWMFYIAWSDWIMINHVFKNMFFNF